jgi:hypothetical protein
MDRPRCKSPDGEVVYEKHAACTLGLLLKLRESVAE